MLALSGPGGAAGRGPGGDGEQRARPLAIETSPTQTPTRPLLELDGYRLRLLGTRDIPFVLQVHTEGGNHLLVDLPSEMEAAVAFLQGLEKQPWAMLMLAESAGRPAGVVANGLTNLVSLNTYVLAMFADPRSATIPVALYARHMFWNFPLNRMYVQFPMLDETQAYAELYRSVGFEQEGLMKKHQAIGGRRYDVAVFGLLRSDFEAYWHTHDARLSLS